MDSEIINRIAIYINSLSLLYPLLRDKYIPQKVKILIYKTILRPLLTYGSEAWVLTSKTRSKLQAAEMRALRLIYGVTRLDRRRNVDIQQELDVESILDFVERTQLRWYGHMMRMEDERNPKKYYEWQPEGRRPRGRPRMRWRQNVEREQQSEEVSN